MTLIIVQKPEEIETSGNEKLSLDKGSQERKNETTILGEIETWKGIPFFTESLKDFGNEAEFYAEKNISYSAHFFTEWNLGRKWLKPFLTELLHSSPKAFNSCHSI